jgi:HK97 family phage major capsid protein
MKISQSLSERRNMLARTTLQLVNKAGPLTQDERSRLNSVRVEMDRLEDDLRSDARYKHEGAFRSFLRNGMAASIYFPGVSAEERAILHEFRDLGTAAGGAGISASGGGIFVPMGFVDKVSSALKYVGPMLDRDFVTVVDTATGQILPFPTDNDTTATGVQIAENQQTTSGDIAGLASVNLKAFKYSSNLVKASLELVQDQNVDLESYLAQRFAVRLGRILNPVLTTGVGTTQPFGVITQATVAGTAAGAGTNDGSSGANTLGSDDLTTLEESLDVAYRSNAKFMVHPNTLAALRKVKDKEGRPVFPDLQAGGENRVLNYPVIVNPAMDQLQANIGSPPVTRKPVAFGDFSKFVVRRVFPTVQRLQERFADYGQLAYAMYWRIDAGLVDGGGGAVQVLQSTY